MHAVRSLAPVLLHRGAMRLLSVLLVAACTTTHTVPRSELDAIAARRGGGDGLVLHSTSVWKTRLDPAAHIRFRNRAGMWSEWIAGDALYVGKHAIYTAATIDLLDFASRIEIRGLGERDREVLEAARPEQGAYGARLTVLPDGTAVMLGSGANFKRWVASFFEAMRASYPAPRDTPPLPCGSHPDYCYLRYTLGGKPFGTWTVYLPGPTTIDLAGEELYKAMDDGLATRYGYRWNEIATAQVEGLSGSLTLTAIVGTAALAIVLAPAALLLRGAPDFRGGSSAAGSSVAGLLTAGGGGSAHEAGTWQPSVLADRDGMAASRLFGAGARRKAIVQLAASAEASLGILGTHALVEGGAAVVRLGQAFEIGAGGLHFTLADALWQRGIARTDSETPLPSGGIAFFRIGAHLPIDAAHRVAVPVSVDIGGGGGEALGVFTRLNWGVRLAVDRHAFVGVAPLTPSFFNWKHDASLRRGSVSSGLELGVVW